MFVNVRRLNKVNVNFKEVFLLFVMIGIVGGG